jgi:NADPH:quinone reductase-like Zn-dependent oxidoreductase
MKAIRYSRFGSPPETVEIVDEDPGRPADDEVLIRVEATPVKLNDLYHISGKPGFQRPLPATPGNEGVGRVVEAGRAVTRPRVGSRVFLPIRGGGTWREVMRVPAASLQEAPEGDPIPLALVTGNGLTAYLMLKDVVALAPGDWIIQNAANSNCGNYLTRLAQEWGFHTVNVVRRESLFPSVREMGGDVVLLDGPDLAARVAAATGGKPIRLAIDAIGGDATLRLAECLAMGGIVANYGFISGEPCKITPQLLMFRDIRLVGYFKSRSMERRSAEEQAAVYAECARLTNLGVLKARIAAVYTFDRVREALAHAAKTGEGRLGKVMLVP